MPEPTKMQFSDKTQIERDCLQAAVRAQLRADLPRYLKRFPAESAYSVLRMLMQIWFRQQTPLFTQMVHEFAFASEESDRFFGPTTISRERTAEIRTRHLLPLDELPIDTDDSMVCGWREFVAFFLEGEDLEWFDALLKRHDDLVSAMH